MSIRKVWNKFTEFLRKNPTGVLFGMALDWRLICGSLIFFIIERYFMQNHGMPFLLFSAHPL